MSMTDPIADMFTRIRNALQTKQPAVDVPRSKFKHAVAEVLKQEGYIQGIKEWDEPKPGKIRIYLKYRPDGEPVIGELARVSRPGCRIYRSTKKLSPYLRGMGLWILSTPRGVMGDGQARREGVGGEVICRIS